MRRLVSVFILNVSAVLCAACAVDTATPLSPSSDISPAGGTTISFGGLSALPCNGLDPSPNQSCAVTTYTESGFTVAAKSGNWNARTDYGNPGPQVQFWVDKGATASGEILVTAPASSLFYFKSIDLYSSTTPIPYTIRGIRSGSTVFTLNDTLPNTFGDLRTIASPNSADAIDTLSVVLNNAAAACCPNPIGLDTIVLTAAPTSPLPPTMFSLSGQVTDSATNTGISGATVSIADGPNAHVATSTNASGNYSFTGLQQAGFTVNVSVNNYVSQSQRVTLTSNQTQSFQLTRQASAPTPPGTTIVGFNNLSADGESLTTYTESSFTVSAMSGDWSVRTTYGNPLPFIQFLAPRGTTATGEVRVSAGGAVFSFSAVDFYSSTTPIPYTITGLRNSSTVFAFTGTLPNTFGNFRTVNSPNAAAVIDALSIVLTNGAAPCCPNPMGLDNIVLNR